MSCYFNLKPCGPLRRPAAVWRCRQRQRSSKISRTWRPRCLRSRRAFAALLRMCWHTVWLEHRLSADCCWCERKHANTDAQSHAYIHTCTHELLINEIIGHASRRLRRRRRRGDSAVNLRAERAPFYRALAISRRRVIDLLRVAVDTARCVVCTRCNWNTPNLCYHVYSVAAMAGHASSIGWSVYGTMGLTWIVSLVEV